MVVCLSLILALVVGLCTLAIKDLGSQSDCSNGLVERTANGMERSRHVIVSNPHALPPHTRYSVWMDSYQNNHLTNSLITSSCLFSL